MIVHQIPKPVICHFIERLTMGGAETLVWRLARGQRESKYEPIVCSLEGGPIQEKLERDGIRVFNLGMPRPPVSRPGRFVARLTSILSALRRTIHGTGTVLVHAHLQDAILLAAAASARNGNAVVGTYHGLGILPAARSSFDPRNPARRLLYRVAARLSDRTLAVSSPVRDRLCQELGFAPERTLLVENGVDTDAFAGARESPGLRRSLEIDDGRRIVACVGRLARGKNQDVLIRAMRRVRVAFPDAMLLLVGDGPLRAELEALVTREELQEGVRFARERTDVAEVLAASDVFVLPSDAEGIPLSLIEAMAAAKPVIATRVPGNVDVIRNPAFGVLVPQRDPDALAMAIASLLSDPERARKLGSAGQAHVRSEFDIRATLARLERIYDEVLEERERRSP